MSSVTVADLKARLAAITAPPSRKRQRRAPPRGEGAGWVADHGVDWLAEAKAAAFDAPRFTFDDA